MRVVPKLVGDHALIGRALADKSLEAREPQLIKLPLPLPSVPVLSPVLSPLIGGSNQNSKPGTTSSPNPSTPSPTSTPSSGSGGDQGTTGGSSGGSTGGDNSGGSTGGNSGGSGNNGGGTNTGGTSDGGGNTGNTSGGDSGNNSGTGQSGTSSSGGTSGSNGGSTTDNPSPSGGTQSSSSGGSNTSSSANSTAPDKGTSGGGNAGTGNSSLSSSSGVASNFGSVGGGNGGAANAASIPTSSTGNGGGGSVTETHNTGTSGHLVGTQGPSGGIGNVAGGDGNSSSTNNGDGTVAASQSSKHGISGGAIAGIVICLLILILAAFVFILRRRRKSRRNERANLWWFSQKRSSKTYGDRDSKEVVLPGNRSARSSFATTVDRSGSPIVDVNSDAIPPLPPMAEVGRGNGSAPKLVIDSSNFNSAENALMNPRFSIGSNQSDTQYLVVHHRDSVSQPGTPMSVRPFSPSESFAFPKPPDPAGDRNSAYSRPSSTGTLALRSSIPSFHQQLIPPVPPTPALPTFAAMSPITKVIDPFSDNNPFEDPAATASNASTGEFAEVEFIRRPFYPTLPDEIAVRPDDPVRILQTFDDGWAMIEKVQPDQSKGGVTGLIPIDCLREAGQDLPSFFAAKRVSSYADADVVYSAM